MVEREEFYALALIAVITLIIAITILLIQPITIEVNNLNMHFNLDSEQNTAQYKYQSADASYHIQGDMNANTVVHIPAIWFYILRSG